MEIEQIEIFDFLKNTHPFDTLDVKEVQAIAQSIEIIYLPQAKELLTKGTLNQKLYLIRTGGVELYHADGQSVYSRFGEGDFIGYKSILETQGLVKRKALTIEDSLLYSIDQSIFLELYGKHQVIQDFFKKDWATRLKTAPKQLRTHHDNELNNLKTLELSSQKPLLIKPDTTIKQTSLLMRENRNNVALIVDEKTHLLGLVTDRAFCDLVVADGLNINVPIEKVMTKNPLTISSDETGSDALITMARHNIRQLPIVQGKEVKGVISLTDIIKTQAHNAVFMVKEINHTRNIEQLYQLGQSLPSTLSRLVRNGYESGVVSHMISSITDAFTQKLIHFAEQKFGKAPIDFCWVCAGSQARHEQASASDQDNALILSDEYDGNNHGKYFKDLAKFVNDGLATIGYIYCPGDVMAMTDKYRQPLQKWKANFQQWIEQPSAQALMLSSIFFDMRPVYGNFDFFKELQQFSLKRTQGNQLFIAHLVANALAFTPPLGFFGRFVLQDVGKKKKRLNMKKRGIIPIVDLARIYALYHGIEVISTQKRIEAASVIKADKAIISHQSAESLIDAYEFITTVRLIHQANLIAKNEVADNFVPPDQLSRLERSHLKQCFELVRTLQQALSTRFYASQMGRG